MIKRSQEMLKDRIEKLEDLLLDKNNELLVLILEKAAEAVDDEDHTLKELLTDMLTTFPELRKSRKLQDAALSLVMMLAGRAIDTKTGTTICRIDILNNMGEQVRDKARSIRASSSKFST